MTENVDVEYKELDRETGKIPESLSKEVVAFANTEGGVVYIGVRDDGSIVGVDNPDDVMTRLSNTLRDTILPDLMPFVQIRALAREGKHVVELSVNVGTQRPYYLARYGLKPRGVYRRVGAACIPVSENGIREMIMASSGKSFEECRCLRQDLTFAALEAEMEARDLEFGHTQMKTLKLIGADGLYTNLAMLLSDQCPYTLKIAIFQGPDSAVFRDRSEFSGSLLKQVADAFAMLERYNGTQARFSGLRREDRRDYPEDAVREALLNSVIHRDYLFSGSTIVHVYADHVEFISLGGLVSGLSLEAIFMGASQSRNPNLAAVFYRLKLVESYGTGVRKIIRLYRNFAGQPEFSAAEGAFKVVLYNRNYGAQTPSVSENPRPAAPASEPCRDAIAAYARKHKEITRKEIETAFSMGSTKAFHELKKLCDAGLLTQLKRGNRTVYVYVGG